MGATHARNEFREMVRSDDIAVNEQMLPGIVGMLGKCVELAAALHGDFAAFAEAHHVELGEASP